MALFSRIWNVFRQGRLRHELDEELADHIEEAVRAGRSRAEAERALGNAVRLRESSMDVKMAVWLETLRADAVFGFRQLRQRPVVTGAAILSLALAIGAVVTAFRLTDAVLLRPLPVAEPQSLFVVAATTVNEATGKTEESDGFSYPQFVEFREAVKDEADLFVVSYAGRQDITYGSDEEMERARRQTVSGRSFGLLGLRPAAGRLLTEADDQKPGGHPVAVITYEYWTRRFGRDPQAIGRTFREGLTSYEIVGVSPEGFTGTEPGTMTDYFIPAMQNREAIGNASWTWTRVWGRLRPDAGESVVRQRLQASLAAHRKERAKGFAVATPKARLQRFLNSEVRLRSAAAGISDMQKNYEEPLLILSGVVLLVLFIACANVANLLTAQTAARAKEMALRVSIGAGRGRLVQMILMECLLLAGAATATGLALAWWWTPTVVGMINPADNPVRLDLPADWRVGAFAALLAAGVTILFGMGPAWRASGVKPMAALKGGEDLRRQRAMYVLIAMQVAFCFVVHFLAGLFLGTFDRLSSQPTGFKTERMLLLETTVKGTPENGKRPQAVWQEVGQRLREQPGVKHVALSNWALMNGNAWTSTVKLPGREVDSQAAHFLSVSPGWLAAMGIGLRAGRDFRPGETEAKLDAAKRPVEGVAMVNEAFARQYCNGENPVGRSFETFAEGNVLVRHRIVGLVGDAKYRRMREAAPATVYVPLGETQWATFTVETVGEPSGMAPALRKTVAEAGNGFRVTNVRTQQELLTNQLIRERLLAILSAFFAVVALVLAAVGLYGVLHYSVQQRRREIGIRMALGARARHIARHVGGELLAMLLVGSAMGLLMGLACEQWVASLLYSVSGREWAVMVTPMLTLFAAAILAVLPPLAAAARMDPAKALRSE